MPNDSPVRQEGAKEKGKHAPSEPSSPPSLVRWAITVGLVIVVGIAVVLLAGGGDPDQPSRGEASDLVRGVSCPALTRAAEFLETGDEEAFHQEVGEAARVAFEALGVSGVAFGAPERAALELEAALEQTGPSSRRVELWLGTGKAACRRLSQ
jgi:hypothetical protein